jgi:protoporphyrin/coproporphyrin ferrochelatase
VPWLGPDVNDAVREAASAGAPAVVLVPIGFVSDHMEVIYDLDLEAASTAADLGLPMARAATPGTDPRFVSMISALATEYAAGVAGEAVAALGAAPATLCHELCCGSGGDRAVRLADGGALRA